MSTGRRTSTLPLQVDSDYRPGQTKAEKKKARARTSAAYYARNPHLREKNRVQLQQRRNAVKQRRRQWDPPKKEKALRLPAAQRSVDSEFDIVSDEKLYGKLHFQDVRGATTLSNDSVFEQVSRINPTESSLSNAAPQSICPTPQEQVAIDVLTGMGERQCGGSDDSIMRIANQLSSHSSDEERFQAFLRARTVHVAVPSPAVVAALATVAELNAPRLKLPTYLQSLRWVRSDFHFAGHYLQLRKNAEINSWRMTVADESADD
ncbi:hypothetical protein C8R43DRAFT_1123654 [Mycena crocata]|nr:hypothetical protein C8R43DRAFT_1123654 [Mycena crocata]